jgi:hypothetical protein
MISSLHTLSLSVLGVLALCVLGCTKPDSTKPQTAIPMSADQPPEKAYRELFLAILNPDETTIRKLIVDNKEADILWSGGSYPPDVAAQLSKQYQQMTIERSTATSQSADADHVLLKSSAFPIPMPVVKIDATWKVDASPLIEMRKKAAEIRKQTEDKK